MYGILTIHELIPLHILLPGGWPFVGRDGIIARPSTRNIKPHLLVLDGFCYCFYMAVSVLFQRAVENLYLRSSVGFNSSGVGLQRGAKT